MKTSAKIIILAFLFISASAEAAFAGNGISVLGYLRLSEYRYVVIFVAAFLAFVGLKGIVKAVWRSRKGASDPASMNEVLDVAMIEAINQNKAAKVAGLASRLGNVDDAPPAFGKRA